jgi:hypothetical protein
MKPGRKPAVNYDKRHDWLRRNRSGESPPAIAEMDGYDQRTVRTNIDLARREEEFGEARATVYREALQSHYADLCGLAERLADTVNAKKRVEEIRNDRLYMALRQHMPVSRIWPSLQKWDALLEDREKDLRSVESRIRKEIKNNEKTRNKFASRNDFVEGVTKALSFQASQLSRGMQGLDAKRDIYLERIDYDSTIDTVGKYGAYFLGSTTKWELPAVRKTVEQLESQMVTSEEYRSLRETENQLRNLKENLLDELAVITLKRVVPGSCRYCPD